MFKMLLSDVFAFDRWHELLAELGLSPAKSVPASNPIGTKNLWPSGGSGESEPHRLLKEYVAHHPEVVGLSAKAAAGKIEFELPSGDRVHVLFEDDSRRIGVEVKGPESSDGDIARGLFQCVKYEAVLEVEQKVQQVPVRASAVLVLGSTLPATLRGLKHTLGIHVIEEVRVPVPKALPAHV